MINERIKELRKSLDMTLEKFGERVGLKKNSLSAIERGVNSVTDRLIMAIVREFGVSEKWLRTGEGEMYPPKDEYDQVADLVDKILRNRDDRERLYITEFIYNKLHDEDLDKILDIATDFIQGLIDIRNKEPRE